MGAQGGYISAQFLLLRRTLKALKSPICGLVSNSADALRKPVDTAASPVQETEGEGKGMGENNVWQQGWWKQPPTVIKLAVINQRGSIKRDAHP